MGTDKGAGDETRPRSPRSVLPCLEVADDAWRSNGEICFPRIKDTEDRAEIKRFIGASTTLIHLGDCSGEDDSVVGFPASGKDPFHMDDSGYSSLFQQFAGNRRHNSA